MAASHAIFCGRHPCRFYFRTDMRQQKNPPERNPSGGSYSLEHLQQTAESDHGIGPVGQLKVELRDTEPAALATVTVTVGRDPREQRPK